MCKETYNSVSRGVSVMFVLSVLASTLGMLFVVWDVHKMDTIVLLR